MVDSPALLDRGLAVEPRPWEGTVFRHMFGDYPPDRENTRGARWNPPDTPAIYTSLSRAGALAEAEHQLAVQPMRPRVSRRTVYELAVRLRGLLDLTNPELLASVGITAAELGADDMTVCQRVGGAVAWLDADGLLVPSARSEAINLVIFPSNLPPDSTLDVLGEEDVPV